ncbi:uncharacterized protein [Misgurnus anguillicaudatus]|uniref:uncharacterized protein n=1 Tax=Misgurnus anguillicaudatus TaxID=75329 RepID=UPI003CCF92DD
MAPGLLDTVDMSLATPYEIKPLQVDEWKSVDLKTEVKDIKRVEKIEWTFNETLIAEIKPANNIFSTYDGDDDLFKDKLKLNHQTGDLTINDIREEHTGVYKLKITRDGEISDKRFTVFVRAYAGKMEKVSVNEGESCTLKTDLIDIKRVDLIEWTFGDDKALIAEINPVNNIFSTYDGDDDLFRDKLKLNDQTGDLTINDIREEHKGVYKLKIIRDGKTSYKRFTVSVRGHIKPLQVYEGESVDLETEVKDIQRDDVIEWRFKETLIAEINPANNIFSTYDGDDDLFRDKLNLNPQTGDLNINNIRVKHKGFYKLKIIRNGKTSDRTFNVFVRDEIKTLQVYKGESVDLKTDVNIKKKGDLIEWRFGDEETPIAELNPANMIFTASYKVKNLFKNKLTLNRKTGDLNIKNISEEDDGVYKLKIIKDGKTSDKRFRVIVRCE